MKKPRFLELWAAAACVAIGSCSGPGATPEIPRASSAQHARQKGAMTHVLTGAYLGGLYGPQMDWQEAAPYLTWAETDQTDATAIHNVGIKALLYLDPNRIYQGNPLYNDDDTTYAHTCPGDKIYANWDNTKMWVTNPASSSMQSLFASYVESVLAYAKYDSIFEDNAGALSAYEPYDPFYPDMPCKYKDHRWIQQEIQLNQAPPIPVIFNGLADLNNDSPSLSIGLVAGSNTVGGTWEGCYASEQQSEENGWLWADIENTELKVSAKGKAFLCMVQDIGDASSEMPARLYAEASFLLTYRPSTSIYWTYFKTPSGFTVLPETQVVATEPVVRAPKDISGLLQSGGAYAREYKACYVAGVAVGPCAAVVNSNYWASATFRLPGTITR